MRYAYGVRRSIALGTAAALFCMSSPVAVSGAAVSLHAQAPPPIESPLQIDHDPLKCVNVDYAPTVDAAVSPGPDLDKGYVYFKAAGTEDFYYTVMKGQPRTLEGVLPRPLPETRAIDYKIRATDQQSRAKEKGEFTPPVVPGNSCEVKGTPVGPNGANLTIGLTREGQNPVPPGFNRKDIAFVILVGGATVALAQALAGAGGGTSGAAGAGAAKAGGVGGSKAALIAGGVAVAAGAGVLIAKNTGGTNATATPLPSATPTPTVTPTPTTAFSFIEADATWSGAGDIDVQILNSAGQPVGTTTPAGCESIAQRTERVLLTAAPAGTYRLVLTGKTCGAGTPASISAVASVQSTASPKCPNAFVSVPVGGSITVCSFTVP